MVDTDFWLKVGAVSASGLTAGLTLSYRLLINPIFNAALHPASPGSAGAKLMPSSRLAVWHTAFNLGMKTIPPFAGLASVLLLTLGLRAGITKTPRNEWMQVSPRNYLIGASIMQLFHIPFTIVAIAPTNSKLIAMRLSKVLDSDKAGMESVQKLLDNWCRLHNVRIASSATAFIMAVAYLAST